MRHFMGAMLLAALACSGKLPHPPYAPQPPTALVEVGFPPPPARAEAVPKKPADDAVWIDGEWAWRGRRWSWNPGRWVIAAAGATFSPWTSVRGKDGTLFFAAGAWRNARGEDIPAPKPLAVGGDASDAVVDVDGEVEATGRTVDPTKSHHNAADGGT